MPQSSYIAAFLLIGFLVFITARGELPKYMSVVLGSSSGKGQGAKSGA